MSQNKLDDFLKSNLPPTPQPPIGEEKRIWLRLKGEELKDNIFKIPLWFRYAVFPLAILASWAAVNLTLYFVNPNQNEEVVTEIIEEHYAVYLNGKSFFQEPDFFGDDLANQNTTDE